MSMGKYICWAIGHKRPQIFYPCDRCNAPINVAMGFFVAIKPVKAGQLVRLGEHLDYMAVVIDPPGAVYKYWGKIKQIVGLCS